MDLDQIKSKLNNLQSSAKGGGEKKDYSKIFWSPKVGKHEVRIVPSAYNEGNPFSEIKVYYGIGSKKVMISPLNFGEKDPIKEFADILRKEYDKENYALSRKLDPKIRIFVPVIVRGEEDKGVRLWQFGKQIYEELLSMAVDEEIGDYTDVNSGYDLKLETVGPEATGTAYNKTNIRLKMKPSKLSAKKEEVELWLSEQPEPLATFTRYSFEDMKASLEQWLEPEVTETDEEENTASTEEEDDMNLDRKPVKKYGLKADPNKKSKDDDWDDVFKDGDAGSVEDED